MLKITTILFKAVLLDTSPGPGLAPQLIAPYEWNLSSACTLCASSELLTSASHHPVGSEGCGWVPEAGIINQMVGHPARQQEMFQGQPPCS